MSAQRSLTSVALFLVAAGVWPLFAQSLADVARKEEERRKTIGQPAKVYTNKDLGGAPPPTPVSTPPPVPAKAGAAPPEAPRDTDADKAADKAADKDKDKPVKDQAYWSGRLKGLQTELDRDRTFADAMQTRVNSLNTDFVNRDDPAQRAVIEGDRQKALSELNRLKQAIQDGTKAVADLREEARRAGVPPGWLR
jgi:hypothetical protein